MLNKLKYKNFVILLLIISAIYIFFACLKAGYFIDELYSYGLSNSYYKTDISDYDIYNKALDNKAFYDYITVNQKEAFNYGAVYFNQINDVHPPIYYMLLHTICSFTPGRLLKSSGIFLNLICMYINLFLLYKLSLKIFEKETSADHLALAATAVYAFSCFAVSTVIYIRMYMLLTLLSVAYALCHVLLAGSEKKTGLSAVAALILILGFLTQYYFIIAAFFISLAYFIYILTKKMWKVAAVYLALMLAALLSSYIIFPHFIGQLGGNHNTYIKNLSSDFNRGIYRRLLRNFIALVSNINYGFFGGRIYFAAAIFIILMIIVNKKPQKAELNAAALRRADKLILVLCLVILLSCSSLLAVIWIPAARYYYNLIPFISIFMTYIVYRYISLLCQDKLRRKQLFAACLAIYLGFNCFGYLSSVQAGAVNKTTSNFKGTFPVDYLYLPQKNVDKFLKNNSGTACLFITDYKNAAVTQDIYELMQCRQLYICPKEGIFKGVNYLSAKKDNLLIIDAGSGLWGSDYNESEVLDELKAYGFEAVELLYEKELTKAYIVRFKQ